MATISTSISSNLFTCSNSLLNSHSSTKSFPKLIKYKRTPISSAYATADRTSTYTKTDIGNAAPSSLYDVLGVRIGADTREVKSAYRKLARVLHPDVGCRDSSADEFMKLHSAYVTLSDPAKRADYDRSLFQWSARASSPLRSASVYRSRRWETDQCW
ncbi:chaperone protein dnaJ 11, chloroplastic-like [Rutidosis leptorrhynchoides]|uniref:chaperone protein dnaJ 11, chloroplastic-like n=1 Tax=Rutidosis leptorrhynchoides TaxID=125765 RepID=UPI003A99EBC2